MSEKDNPAAGVTVFIFPDTNANGQLLLAQLFDQFLQNFPPGSDDSNDPDKSMSTDDVFILIDNHVPDIVTQTEVAALLFKYGYISRYNRTSNEFVWLIG